MVQLSFLLLICPRMWLCQVLDIDIHVGLLGAMLGLCWAMLFLFLNLCWAKNGVFLEAIWGLSWAYAGGKRMVCWAHVGSRYAAMLRVVVNCQETHTHSIGPEHRGMFHSQFCFAAMLLHGRYLTWQFCFQRQHGYVQTLGKLFKTKNWRLRQSTEEKKQLEKQMLMRHS